LWHLYCCACYMFGGKWRQCRVIVLEIKSRTQLLTGKQPSTLNCYLAIGLSSPHRKGVKISERSKAVPFSYCRSFFNQQMRLVQSDIVDCILYRNNFSCCRLILVELNNVSFILVVVKVFVFLLDSIV